MSREVIRQVYKLTRALQGRVRGLIRRASIGTLDATGKGQTLQAKTTANDVDDAVELFEAYGFTSAPPGSSECLVLRVGGERAHSVAILAGDRAKRPAGGSAIAQGEVAVYHQNGSILALRNDQTVEVTTPQGASITIQPGGAIDVTPAPGQTVNLAGPAGLPVARATDPVAVTSPAMLTLKQAFDSWVPVAQDGGVALKTALASFLSIDDAVVVQGAGTITAGGAGSTSS